MKDGVEYILWLIGALMLCTFFWPDWVGAKVGLFVAAFNAAVQ